MIHHCDSHTVALLANDKVVTQTTNPCSTIGWLDLAVDCSRIRTCAYSRELAVLMLDNRVLITHKAKLPLIDITPIIKGLVGDASIRDIHLASSALVFTAGHHLGAVCISRKAYKTKISAGTHLVFEHEIDLAVFDNSMLALVRTVDNKLHLINSRSWANNKLHWPLREIAFHDTENISEMLYVGGYFTLLTCDGRVYVYNCHLDTGLAEPFEQLRIPTDESVVKIVNSYGSVVYLTDRGNCYYMNLYWGELYIRRPRSLQALQGLFVENVFWLDDCESVGIAQHDCKLTYFRLAVVADGEGHIPPCSERWESYCSECSNTVVEMRHLPFFDNKCIVSVASIPSVCTYFITDEGHVYSAASLDEGTVYERDPFFDANPIAVEKGSQHIRSALSFTHTDV